MEDVRNEIVTVWAAFPFHDVVREVERVEDLWRCMRKAVNDYVATFARGVLEAQVIVGCKDLCAQLSRRPTNQPAKKVGVKPHFIFNI
ncbi:hypothetical protein D3C71_1625610 [compost metagenome]